MLMLSTLLVQDLKDFGREAGNVSFADIDRDAPGQGYIGVSWMLFSVLMRLVRILEYLNREDAERAVKELDGRDLRGQAVRVDLFEDVSAWLFPPRWGLGFN
jgi:splicing factor, arginine/serine-rich 4/5/6